MINFLCFLGIHKRTRIDKSRGITGGLYCLRCLRTLIEPLEIPPRRYIKKES